MRNPWDWLVSYYLFLLRKQFEPTPEDQKLEFKNWLLTNLTNSNTTKLMAQSRWITDANGNMIVDQLGRFEQLTEDFTAICYHMAIDHRPLKHKNKTDRIHHYRHFYDDELQSVIAKHYQEDLERFNYTF